MSCDLLDRLEFFPGRIFSPFSLADVRVDDEPRLGPALFIPHQGPAAGNREVTAVTRDMAKLSLPSAVLQDAMNGRVKVIGPAAVEKSARVLAKHFLALPAIHAFRALVPVKDALLQVTDHDRVACQIKQGRLLADLLVRSVLELLIKEPRFQQISDSQRTSTTSSGLVKKSLAPALSARRRASVVTSAVNTNTGK